MRSKAEQLDVCLPASNLVSACPHHSCTQPPCRCMIPPDQLQADLLRSLHIFVQQRCSSDAHADFVGPATEAQQTC